MAITVAKVVQEKGYNTGTDKGIGANSADFGVGTLVGKTAGFVTVSGAGTTIEGVSITTKTMASDNQTVAQEKVIYIPADDYLVVQLPITGGTVTQADEGVSYYDLNASQQVDGTTESATTGQVKLKKFISATLGDFEIVNA